MALDGYAGANIRLGSGGGASVDNALAALAVMGGKYHVVINDDVDKQPTPERPTDQPLCRLILSMGGIVAARFTLSTPGENAKDDDADAKFLGDELARIQIDKMNRIGKHPNLFGYGGNELGDNNHARQEEFLVTYLDTLGHAGYRAVVGNYSYKNPTHDLFALMPRAVAAIDHWKAMVGFHEGTVRDAKTFDQAVAYGAIGRARMWRERYGFKLWLTEFAGSYDAHNGYRVLYADDMPVWYDVLRKTAEQLRIPFSIYCMFEWQNGFHIYNDLPLLEEVGTINRLFPVLAPEEPPMLVTVYAADYICPDGSTFGVLSTNETVYCRTVDGRQYQCKNELAEQFITRPGAIERGADWSSLWTPDGKYQGFFYVQYKQRPAHPQDGWGAVWVEDWLTEGEEKTFPCWVVEYWHDGRIKAGPVESPNRIKFVKHYANYTLPTGVTIPDVIELLWRGEEVYAYQKGFGLVLWKNLRTEKTNYLVRGASGPAKAPIYPIHMPPDHWRNNVTQTYPPPTTGGENAALAKVPNSQYVFIRQQPNPTSSGSNPSAIVGELLIGDVVQYYPDAPVGAWVYVDPQLQVTRPPDRKSAAKGWVSLQGGAVEFVPPLLPPIPAPTGRLLTPEAEGRLRAHLQAISDATAAITAELDSAPEIGAPPDSGIPF
jgi:hypothetical protein